MSSGFSRPRADRQRSARALIACVALAVALSACGRRGALEPPPGTPEATQNRQAASQDTFGRSTAGGSTTFRPARETDTGQPGMVSGAAPPVPTLVEQVQVNTNPANTPTVNSPTAAGLRTQTNTGRRSPPPTTPFVLDPLL